MKKHISHDFKCKFYSITCNSNQKWNKEICRGEHKNYRPCKKDNSWNPSIIIDMDIVLTKMANTKAANFYDKKIVIIKRKNKI